MRSFLIFTAVVFIGCHAKSWQPLNPDEKLFRSKCSSCHSLPNPTEYTDSQWKLIVRKHVNKSKLDDKHTIQITRYLQNNNIE